MTGALIKKRKFVHRDRVLQKEDTHTRWTSCGDEGRYQGDSSPNQGIPKTASQPPEAMREA